MAGTLSFAEDDAGPNRGTGSTSDHPTRTSITRLVTVAVLMAGTEVTTGGCVDIGTTPVVHVTVISTEGGTGDTVMETSPGMRLPEATLATERRGSPDRRAREASTSRTSGETSRIRTTCPLSRGTGYGGKSTSERT